MAKGKDERHNSNRKVSKEALGNRYAEIGVGFDTQVSKPLSIEDEIAQAFMTDEELALQDDDGLGPEGDTRSDELSARHQKEDVPLISDREDHSALLPSQQTGNRYEY